jgi:acetoin utilization deacetylase AcuC-like enzyme
VRGLQRVAIVDFDVHHGNGTRTSLPATIGC